jgi:hypothetical protein
LLLKKTLSDSTKKFYETDVTKILGSFLFATYLLFSGRFFQQLFAISMDTNRTPLLVGLFLNSYEVDFVHGLLKKNEKKLSRSFSFKYFTFLYIDVVLSLNNFKFSDFVDRFLICWICIYTGNETACRIFVWYPNYIKWTEIANKYFFLKVVFPMSPDFVTQTDDIPNCNWYLLTSHIDNHGSRSVCKAFTFATKVYSLYEQFSPNKELSWSCNLKRLGKISAKTISRAYSKTACVYLLPAGMETTSASRVYEGGFSRYIGPSPGERRRGPWISEGSDSLHSYLHELRETIVLVMSELLQISLFHPFNGFEFFLTDTCSNYLYNLQDDWHFSQRT